MKITTLFDYLTWAEKAFQGSTLYFGHGTNNPWDDAVALARAILKLPPDVDKSVLSRPLSEEEKETLLALSNRRIKEHIPVPYLTHEAYFAGLKFYVDERVIIPRSPFGELIRNRFQPWLQRKRASKPLRILDLCTGSACMAIAAAHYLPEALVDASDISKAALEVASINQKMHHCGDRVQLLQGDLFAPCHGRQYDLIISNPPYVPVSSFNELPREFSWEPKQSLVAGHDGLDVVRRILKEGPQYLNPNGLIFIEVGEAETHFKKQYPNIPVTWITFKYGGEGVFMLREQDKQKWQIIR